MKVLIDEIAAFMNDDSGWPDPKKEWYYDTDSTSALETEIGYNLKGFFPKEPGKTVKLEDYDADVCYQGTNKDLKDKVYSLVSLFKKWQVKQKNEIICCHIPKTKVAEFRACVKQMGGKIA